MVSTEYETGETSGDWYGEATQIRSLWMRLQETEPRLLIRPPSARCNCCNESAQETTEWKTLRTAQVEAVTAGNNDTRGSEATRELGRRETRDEAKRVIWNTRSNGTMENMVVQDESVLCSSCHKTALPPERVDG